MFDKRSISLTVPNPAATITGTLNLRTEYAQILGFKALLTGTDTAVKVRITDADSRIVYLDAADKDYKTAAIQRVFHQNDDATGLSVTSFDSTGAAAIAEFSAPSPIVRNPLEIAVVNGGTAGDVIDIQVVYKSLPFGKVRTTLTVPNPAATVSGTVNIPGAKYAQVIGFRALLTGTDTTARIKLTDADSVVFYLDAADKDYKTAAINRAIQVDDTTTGLGISPTDATGTVLDAVAHPSTGAVGYVARSPITAELSNGGTAGDVLTLDLYYLR